MLSIHNTLSGTKEVFQPIIPGQVRMYVCGMTVYDLCHLGHARVMVVFDMVYRWFKSSGYHVTYVRNITDIDDKIIRRAQENGETIRALTDRYIAAMHEDADALGVLRPDFEPRATEHVPGMLYLIGKLEKNGYAYVAANQDVCYAVRRFEPYGRLSKKPLDDLRAGERVEVAGGKQDPLDFVLWKAAKPGEPDEAKWASPWGSGRPGWHIECSAMSCALLGEHFDIHGGGQDLQFPHHENEIAQSEGASGQRFVNYWMHNGFVRVDEEKMSKSLGNFFTIREVLARYEAEVVRYFILRAHYRSALNYSDAHLEDARNALRGLYNTLWRVAPGAVAIDWADPYAARFQAAMDDDFDSHGAVTVLHELAGEVNRTGSAELAGLLRALGGVLGLLQDDPRRVMQGEPEAAAEEGLTAAAIEALIAARAAAKKAKNYAEADRIRNELKDAGVVLEDTPAGTLWRRA